MSRVLERLPHALNRRDLDAMLECFDPDYRSEQPAHPNRGLGGKEQVRKNWSGMFEGFPDFQVELLRHGSDGDVVWSEWRWSATGLTRAGIILMGVKQGRISWAPRYMEPVGARGRGQPRHRRSDENHNRKRPDRKPGRPISRSALRGLTQRLATGDQGQQAILRRSRVVRSDPKEQTWPEAHPSSPCGRRGPYLCPSWRHPRCR
jgi:SnoaL-like domain